MGLSAPPGLSPDQGLGGSQGLSIGDGLSFQQLGPVGENGILMENDVDYIMIENSVMPIYLILQE